MKPVQQQLLESLGSGVRPVDLGERSLDSTPRFDGMLTQAIHGRARTELGVTFAPAASGMFDHQQQEQISRAVDIAAAAGSQQALILQDRHTLRVDVRNRVVLDAPVLGLGGLIDEIDAFVCAHIPLNEDDSDNPLPAGASLIVPARVVRNASLARTLAQSSYAGDP